MNQSYLDMARNSYQPRKPETKLVNNIQTPAAIDLSTITDDDLRRECKEGLVLLIRNNKGNLAALAAIRELLNRIDGTPAQTIKQSVEVKATTTHIHITDERLDQVFDQLFGQQPITIDQQS